MADQLLTIPKTPELDHSEDYSFLRKEGLEYIEKLSHKLWTDYNSHDPGITIHELLCYAITDLGYRTSFSIPDLLAGKKGSGETLETIANFFTAKQILPVNPTTETDIRKAIMDVPGVKNAWLAIAKDYDTPVYVDHANCKLTLNIAEADTVLPVTGLYNVLIQYEEDNLHKEEYDAIREKVRQRLMATRNLCEDYLSISQIQYEDIAVCSDIEVRQDADITKLQAKIFQLLIDYFSPPVSFYTLDEMVEKGKTMDEIFEGPLLQSGFIDDEELEQSTLRKVLYTSDLYNLIMDLPEVIAIKSLKLIRYVNGEQSGIEETWQLELGNLHAARLEKLKSKFTYYKGVLPYMAHPDDVETELKQLQQVTGKFRKRGHEDDIEIEEGNYRELSDYFPVQNDFPLVYGIGQAGLPTKATDERKAQARQLKAYLLFFEQLLSNYLSQLANIKTLFSRNHTVDRDETELLRSRIDLMNPADVALLTHYEYGIRSKTYFVQALSEDDINDLAALYNVSLPDYPEKMYTMTETPERFSERRNRFLNHLLARFCEDLTEYSLTLFQMYGKNTQGELFAGLRLAADKEALLADYPKLSRDRGKGFNYKPHKPFIPEDPEDAGTWETVNISGLKHRVTRLLGMEGGKLDFIALQHLLIEGSGPNNNSTPYRVKLIDDNGNTLLVTGDVPTRKAAGELRDSILWNAFDTSSFFKTAPGVNPPNFWLTDCCDNDVIIASSPDYASEAERDAALVTAQSLFSENRMVDVIRRRTIATHLLNLRSAISGADTIWWVVLSDPNAMNEYLLSSGPGAGGEDLFKQYDIDHSISTEVDDPSEHDWSKGCAESQLLYMLHNGDNPTRYTIWQDSATGKYYYVFLAECEPPLPVAFSRPFDTEEECRAVLDKCTLRFFRDECDIEDFHVLEHILLRPRTNLDPLLPSCVVCKEKPVTKKLLAGQPEYSFEVYRLVEKEESLEGKKGPLVHRLENILKSQKSKAQLKKGQTHKDIWGFLLNDAQGYPMLYSEGYTELNNCLNGIASVRENGINTTLEATAIRNSKKEDVKQMGNYRIFPESGKYHFKIYADNGRVIAESAYGYASIDETAKLILELADFLAYQQNILPEQDDCAIDEDPYSFRISVVLPAWPTRFRSQYFRRFIEKVIRQETPAHIFPKICWVDLEQMRQFEEVYRTWIQGLSSNDMPNPNTARELIESLYTLKNVYPVAVLHSCDDIHGDDPQVILDNTSLGNL